MVHCQVHCGTFEVLLQRQSFCPIPKMLCRISLLIVKKADSNHYVRTLVPSYNSSIFISIIIFGASVDKFRYDYSLLRLPTKGRFIRTVRRCGEITEQDLHAPQPYGMAAGEQTDNCLHNNFRLLNSIGPEKVRVYTPTLHYLNILSGRDVVSTASEKTTQFYSQDAQRHSRSL